MNEEHAPADRAVTRGPALPALALLLAAAPARAASDEVDSNGAPIPSIATSLPNNGDPGGMRKWLYERGLTYSFVLTSEVLGDVAGGMRRGAVFQGKLETIVKADLEKMLGLRGLSFFTNSFQIHNTGGIRRDSCRQLQHDQQHRGAGDHAVVRDLARAEILQRHVQRPLRSARRRRRVLHQRLQRVPDDQRLAVDHGAESAERRTGLSAFDAGHPAEVTSRTSRSRFCSHCSTAIRPGPDPRMRRSRIAMD